MKIMKGMWVLMLVLATMLSVGCKKDQAEIDEALIAEYVAADTALSGAIRTGTGLYYVIQEPGTNEHPDLTSTVSVYYDGVLLDGTRFDSALRPNAAADLPLGYTISGWQEGIPFIGRTGKIILIIPSELAYGNNRVGNIPPNSVLRFDVELVDFY